MTLMSAVRHIEAHHIHAGMIHLFQHIIRACGRPYGADNFCLSQ